MDQKKNKSGIAEYANAHPFLTFLIGFGILSNIYSIAVAIKESKEPHKINSNETQE